MNINFKKLNNEIIKLKSELSEANKALNKLTNEARTSHAENLTLGTLSFLAISIICGIISSTSSFFL